MRILAAILALAAPGLNAELQFSGFFLTQDEALFILRDTQGGEVSPWLGIGGSFHSCVIRSFDREHDVLTVERDGRQERLRLRDPKVRDARLTVEGAITRWPGGQSRGVRASLFLGEEAAFPLGEGVTLHLLAERLPDGNLIYHCRIVTVGQDGRQGSQAWPSVVTPPRGEFSIRVGDVGFSFRP
jgi:hypothetical protein